MKLAISEIVPVFLNKIQNCQKFLYKKLRVSLLRQETLVFYAISSGLHCNAEASFLTVLKLAPSISRSPDSYLAMS